MPNIPFNEGPFFPFWNVNSSEFLISNHFLCMLTSKGCFFPIVINIGKFNSSWSCIIPFAKPPPALLSFEDTSVFDVFLLWPMHWFWDICVWLSSESVISCSSGHVFDPIDKTISLHVYTDPAFIIDKFSLLQLLVTQNGSTFTMSFTDNLGPKPFHTVLIIHRMAGLTWYDFSNLFTLTLLIYPFRLHIWVN